MIHYVYVILALYGYFNFAIGSSNYNTFCENPHEYNGHAVVHHQNTFSMSCDDVLGVYSLSNISLADCHDLSISLWSEVFGSSNTSINVYDPPYFDQRNNISVGAVTRTGGCCRDGKPLCRNPSANTFCKNPDKYIGDAGVFGSGTSKNFTCNQAMHFLTGSGSSSQLFQCKSGVPQRLLLHGSLPLAQKVLPICFLPGRVRKLVRRMDWPRRHFPL